MSQLFASRLGEGKTVVLLHGLFGMPDNRRQLALWLAADYTGYNIDLPGHGRSIVCAFTDLASMAVGVEY